MAAVLQAYNQTCAAGLSPGRSWLARAAPRRKLAFQDGLLAGGRYNHIEPYGTGNNDYSDCQVHPYAGLYTELFQPGRTLAV